MPQPNATPSISGALLIDKPTGISSFGVIETLQKAWMERYGIRRRDLPKLGHGGTLDPFATGLLIVCVGSAVKLSRYFLDSTKGYEGVMRFGETTIPGDPTAPISETSSVIPKTREEIQTLADRFLRDPYLQIPPMHSAKKKDGKPLYELARQGLEVERAPKSCRIFSFEILSYTSPRASFRVLCSSGTYIRTLTQDLAKMAGSVALLETLNRTSSGARNLSQALTLQEIQEATFNGKNWNELDCWIPFDQLLTGYPRAEASESEALALQQGRQNVLPDILRRIVPPGSDLEKDTTLLSEESQERVAIYKKEQLIAIAARVQSEWGLERVFCTQ